MQFISAQIKQSIEGGSWIRRMFEAGIQLKQKYGNDAVCDFSLGNPDLAPPEAVGKTLRAFAEKVDAPFSLGYMPNAGFPWAREKLAAWLAEEHKTALSGNDVLLSCGAAGALNAFFHSVLEPGDEVLTFAPCFVEYVSYVANHGGVLKTVPSETDTFAPDFNALENAITAKTRALIINSPHNPTGVVYTEAEIRQIAELLQKASEKYGRAVYLVADEPYRFLTFDGVTVPSPLPLYPYAVVVSSFSKNLSLAGERIGYIALSPLFEERSELMGALTLSNRVLGFVNPPVIGQHIMAGALGSQVDVEVYRKRRDLMASILQDAGYEFRMPQGAFYFFPKAPGGDDVAFVNRLVKERILAVPGKGFFGPGYFRLAFCVEDEVIARSAEGFKKAIQK
ncbi:MAG: pyridoxal phosphate-dependent aminotransferase [Desulfovibrionaceae bacterium]|nr:pyridoxal phosphate-dependent aminotransferase [Desulfovibrionaceae bacterium]